ncbi:MAG: oligoribonuclease [Candidatus Saccharimonadales bacterium]
MQDLKKITPKKLFWVDLEMTGLDPARDRILEVAVVVTDWDFKELDRFESGVGQDAQEVQALLDANEFYAAYPQNKQALLELAKKSPAENAVEVKLVELVNKHFINEPALLAGNSIHQDRLFIRKWWPTFEQKLHYRMLDVSAWKVVMAGKYGIEYQKKESHRAVDDIQESIEELEFYLKGLRGDNA